MSPPLPTRFERRIPYETTVVKYYAYVADGNGGLIILRYTGASGSAFSGTVVPIWPTGHTIPGRVMQGGTVYRYFRLLDAGDNPVSGATVAFSVGEPAVTDAQGYFTYTVRADVLGGTGSHRVSVRSISYGGETYGTGGEPSFTVEIADRRYSYAWSYAAKSKVKGGVSSGLILYVQRKCSGGLELELDESDPDITSDDIVFMREIFDDEVGVGGGVGEKLGVDVLILHIGGGAEATTEFDIRSLGHIKARFPDPYRSEDKKAQAIFLLFSVIDSIGEAFPGKPFAVGLLKLGMGNTPYRGYISEQQAGAGIRVVPLRVDVGAKASLGLERGPAEWRKRILGFEAVDVGVEVLTLNTLTDYWEEGEWGLGSEMEFDLDFSVLSWEIDDFRNKFLGVIGDRAGKVKLELFFDAETDEFKRLELSLTGEGNPDAFTDVVKEEVTVKLIIPADQMTPEVLNQTVNVLRLLEAARNMGDGPLQIGPSAMVNELNALLAPLDYVEYEITVEDGAEVDYETELAVTAGIEIELGPGLEVKKVRRLVREKGVFINGRPYTLESYDADGYVSRPGKSWWNLTTNALGGLWELVKDAFSWVKRQVSSGVGWVVGVVSRTVEGIVRGGAQVIAPAGTQLYAQSFGPQGITLRQTGTVTVTAVGWVPEGGGSIMALGLSPAAGTASGEGFVVGGIYEFRPYTLTLSPAATLVITYTDEAAAGVDESRVGVFRWNPEGNNWQPMDAVSDEVHNVFTATITQLGTFALGYDSTPPQVSIREPVEGGVISNTLPLLVALVVDEGVGIDPATVEMRLDGQVVAAQYITGTGELMYLPSEPLASGSHTVSVSAEDMVGNRGTASAVFTVEVIHRIYLPLTLRER